MLKKLVECMEVGAVRYIAFKTTLSVQEGGYAPLFRPVDFRFLCGGMFLC